MSKHSIIALDQQSGVTCKCGRTKSLEYPGTWGWRSAFDALLDFYNIHRASMIQQGK